MKTLFNPMVSCNKAQNVSCKGNVTSKISKGWYATKKHLSTYSGPYIVCATWLTELAFLIPFGIHQDKKQKETMDFIKQVDYNKYIDLCEKSARGKTVNWDKAEQMIKDSIVNKSMQNSLKQDAQEANMADETHQ